jgi:hypothetical protein
MPKQEKQPHAFTVSRVLSDGSLLELIYSPKERKTLFLVSSGGRQYEVNWLKTKEGESLVPVRASHSFLAHQLVLLPSEAAEYGTTAQLVEDIKAYIRKYVTLHETFYDVSAYYCLLSWVFDAFNEVPYLRWKGDFGSGKTRALRVIGSIMYKPIFASGASTVSPIFHSLDLFRGTLIVDEADFRLSDERAELTKIFNNGSTRGFPVLRASMSDKKDFDPRAFDVYGPKLVGMREVFQDYALESRFITEEMVGYAGSKVPTSLPAGQEEEALQLRNKLLMFRFREWHRVKIDEGLVDPALSPRSNQILLPLLSLIPNAETRGSIKNLLKDHEAELARERGTQMEGLVLEAIADLIEKEPTAKHFALSAIRHAVIARHSSELERPMTSRYLGGLIRNRLHLKSFKRSTYMVEVPQPVVLRNLCMKYGIRWEA